MSRESSPRSKRWKATAVKVAVLAALFALARLLPVAGTIGLLMFLAAVVKPATNASSRR